MADKRKMTFKAHGSFFIRKGWLGKGLRAVDKEPQLLNPSNIEFAMDYLGLGKNMVGSLRYWMKTLELISEDGRGKDMHADLSPLGALVFNNDPYVEEIGTLWCLHSVLVSQRNAATSWYWLFNEFGTGSFTKEEAADGIQKYAVLRNAEQEEKKNSGAARSSIESDVDCILSTYISQERRTGQRTSPENVIDCPFGELGIIDIESSEKKTYKKRQPNLSILPSEIVLYSIARAYGNKFSDDQERPSVVEIPLDVLLNGENYPGRVFNLDSVGLLSKLYELENDGFVRINRTAGSDVVRLSNPTIQADECLQKYYELIG